MDSARYTMLGRHYERDIMEQLLHTDKAEMLTVTGRRRVGKTFLIKKVFENNLVFEFTGTQNSSKKNQLKKFAIKLAEYNTSTFNITPPKDWMEAFEYLKTYLKGLRASKKKKVLFFDELPWLASPKSGFLEEYAYWWNDWACNQNIVVVICGSAASWMIKKIINNKGSLHNRTTCKIELKPFTLAETKEFIHKINPAIDNYQILQIYMSMGGIPHYLNYIQKRASAPQVINELCFQKDGPLRKEFKNLYAALFDNPERHIEVIKALATKWKGMTRQEIILNTNLSDGGNITKVLNELEASSFIMQIQPFGKKKKDALYRLVDEYSIFYLEFIEGHRAGNKDIWLQQSKDNKYKSWRGYAFENICMKHEEAIKQALGISGIGTTVSGYKETLKETDEIVQIDMIIDRADNTINLCEMKFYNTELIVSKELGDKLRRRRGGFQHLSKTKKTVYNTLVTTYGIIPNQYSLSQIDQHITMDALFELQSF